MTILQGQKFGVGVLIGTSRYDAQGNLLAVPQSIRFGLLQDVSTEFSFEEKPLYGSLQFPADNGRGKGKASFSAKLAKISAAGFAALHFGAPTTTGFSGPVIDEAHTIPATPFQVTPVPPSSGTIVDDLGVSDTSGNQFIRVASAPATGQYEYVAGVYTFAAADTGKAVLISYEYTSSTSGTIMQLTNQLMGYSPAFSVMLYNNTKGSQLAVKLNKCESDKLSLPFKNEDWAITDMSWQAFDDGTGTLGYWSMA